MNHFFALLYYFGIVRLPSKRDYWLQNCEWLPSHPICQVNGMTRERFEFLWRYFHCNRSTNDDFENDDTNVDEDEDNLVDLVVERCDREQQQEQEQEEDAIIEEDEDPSSSNGSDVWYEKIFPIVDHVRKRSMDLIYTLGTHLALDEQMIRFMGRSLETHRMKNKPIKEGFKFFVLATIQGFVVNFSPDGRTAAKSDKVDYDINNVEFGKIGSMIMYLVDSVTKLLEKQSRRVKAHCMIRKTRLQKSKDTNENQFETEENMSKKFIIAMDNYFTRPKVIAALSELDIGVVGTSRFTKSWPPTSLKQIKDAHFNEFFFTTDEHGTLVARWMDNGMVFCVSTVHRVGQTIKRCRRKPRVTPKNKAHVDKVWGDKGKMDIEIPRLIDDYNHWMGGVDLSDQHISYYHPNLRCRRNWIPMFIQMMSIIRSNAYIVHKNYFKRDALSHKIFTLEMISCLTKRALDDKDHTTCSASQSLVSSLTTKT